MAIQRSASRRRLVLFNDRNEESGSPKKEDRTEIEAAPTYSRRAHPRWLPTAAVLAPGSWWKLALCWIMGMASIAGLLSLHVYHEQWEATIGAGALDSFDLAQRGNLASWFLSVFMIWGAMLSLVVFSIRKHRVDDYRGGYRVWITTALAFVCSAMVLTTGLTTSLNATLFHLTQWPSESAASLWALIVFGPILSGLVLRMLFELRESRLATLSLGVAVFCISAGSAVSMGILTPHSFEPKVAASGLLLAGYFQVVFAAAAYSRFVLLDAQGMITRKIKQAEATPDVADEDATADPPTLRIASPDEESEADEDSKSTAKKSKRKPRKAVSTGDPEAESSSGDPDADDADSGDPAPLTRAERKKQRRMKRKDKRSAA